MTQKAFFCQKKHPWDLSVQKLPPRKNPKKIRVRLDLPLDMLIYQLPCDSRLFHNLTVNIP
jgi:hypothetical protein